MDVVRHYWTRGKVFKAAYINNPDLKKFVSAPQFAPPFHLAAPNRPDLGTRIT